MKSLLFVSLAWLATFTGAAILAPAPETFSRADGREFLMMAVSFIIGWYSADRE